MRRLAFRLLRWSGLPWLLRMTVQRRRVTILVYHDPTPEVVERHFEMLRRTYRHTTLREYVDSRTGSGPPLPSRSIVVTFDDGYASNYALRETFRATGVTPSIFVCTGIVGTSRAFWFRHAADVEALKRLPDSERLAALEAEHFSPDAEQEPREALSDAEIRDLLAVADIQPHTMSHPILPRCADDRAQEEIAGGKRELEGRFGVDVYALAYPNGDYTERETEVARSAGYRCALAVGGRTNSATTSMFSLQRIAIDDRDGVDELLVKASGLWGWVERALGRGPLLPALLALAVLAGWIFRVGQYAANRSLWYDESLLALNILGRSLAGVTRALDLNQAAPTVFLLLEKLATDAFGSSELTLRLLPFLCGLASVPLFLAVARRVVAPPADVVATVLFACAAAPLYYASEVKQYSGDVFATLVLYLLGLALFRSAPTLRRGIAYGAIGIAAVALSHAAVLVAGGVALVLGIRFLARRGSAERNAFATSLVWVLAAGVDAAFALSRSSDVQHVIGGSSDVYIQTTSSSAIVDWWRELLSALTRSIGYPDNGMGAAFHWPVVVLAFAGAVSFALRRSGPAALVVSPVVPLALASAVHRYPLFDRTVLFLVPAAILLAAEGVNMAMRLLSQRAAARTAGAIAAIVLLAAPVSHAAEHLVQPRKHEEIKAALTHIREHWRPGDVLFVDGSAQFALRYYLQCDCFAPADVRGGGSWRFRYLPLSTGRALGSRPPRFVVGRAEPNQSGVLLRELDRLHGRRVWVLYTHVGSPDQAAFLARAVPRRLDRQGRRLDAFETTGARAYLYDLR